MRTGVLALVLIGCSSPVQEAEPPDASPPVEDDAGALPAGDAAVECTPAASSLPYGTACDGGYLYGSYGGTCPRGDVGTCTVLSADAIGNYAEACCERLACVRVDHPTGDQCVREHDSGAWEGWACPAGVAAPAGCEPLAPGSRDVCCPR